VAPRIGIVIPACDEEECIGSVLAELLRVVGRSSCAIVVGVNGSSDRTAAIARNFPVFVAETAARGYGYGCQAAIDLLNAQVPSVSAYIFFAGDGASDPRDIAKLLESHDRGYDMVLGARTTTAGNWRVMSFSHVLANFALGLWCGLLSGRWFTDLGPLRLIERELFQKISPQEMTFGWTIQAQIAAAMLDAKVCEVAARERSRIGGEQKVSGVTWRRTFSIGCRIVAAGVRTRRRFRSVRHASRSRGEIVAQPQAIR
jgi:hypothetical protein